MARSSPLVRGQGEEGEGECLTATGDTLSLLSFYSHPPPHSLVSCSLSQQYTHINTLLALSRFVVVGIFWVRFSFKNILG